MIIYLTIFLFSFSLVLIQSSLVVPLSDDCIQNFENECLRVHNKIRAKHSAAPLALNSSLSHLASNYSNYLASIDKLVPSNQTEYSETFAEFYSSTPFDQANCASLANNLVTEWNIGWPIFNFNIARLNPNLYHNTTKELGCGISLNEENIVYTVVFYSPKRV